MAILDTVDRTSVTSAWGLKAELTDDAGLVLREVSHDGYSFATDLRLVKIWASSSSPQTPNSFTQDYLLGSTAFPAKPANIQQRPSAVIPLIRPYPSAFEIAATFETAGPVLGDDSFPLKVEQTYIFTDYGRTPIHEPGAILKAARCYPMVKFSYPGNQKTRRLRFLRFDYRFDISIDASRQAATKGQVDLSDQAGVFTDMEKVAPPPTIGGIFFRAEKPLAKEIIGEGLNYGLRSTWDNIHQWGTQSPLPSTPGAFHAAHTHWRWGATAATGQSFPSLQGAPHFAGLGGPGGPLIDPRVPHQDIRFAVTGRGSDKAAAVSQWAVKNHPSERDFDSLFTNARNPADISKGATLTQWFSITVRRSIPDDNQNGPWEGALFTHGYFFSHEEEDLGLIDGLGGLGAKYVSGLKDALTKEDGVSEKNGWIRK